MRDELEFYAVLLAIAVFCAASWVATVWVLVTLAEVCGAT